MGVAQTLSLISSLAPLAGGSSNATTSTQQNNPQATSWGNMSTAGKVAAVGIGSMGLLGLIGNSMSSSSAGDEADALEGQGNLALSDALLEADRTAEEGRLYQADQKMKYIMSGVLIAGSPIAVLDDTAEKVQREVKAIQDRGAATKALYYAKARQTRSEGRAGFLSGLVSTGANVFTLYNAAKKGGLFDSTGKGDNLPKDGTKFDSNAFNPNMGYA